MELEMQRMMEQAAEKAATTAAKKKGKKKLKKDDKLTADSASVDVASMRDSSAARTDMMKVQHTIESSAGFLV